MAVYPINEIGLESNELQTKTNFDNVKPLNEKPSAVTEGLTEKKSDWVKSEYDDTNIIILTETPNLYKQIGVSVSKIPYFFETPIPKYFREKGLFKNEKTWKFVSWAFSKCSNQPRTIIYDNCEITLQPYEFICGRNSSSAECFLTPKEFRGQLDSLIKLGLTQKGANSKANRFSTYIWVTSKFSDNKGQLAGQLTGQHRANSGPQSICIEDINDIEDHHPSIPSFENEKDDELIDDLFSKKENKSKILIHEGRYPKGDLYKVYLTQEELDECLKSRGSLERIKEIIDQVAKWPGRNFEIRDWFKTIKEWKFKNAIANRTSENEELGKKIEELYGESDGWRAYVHRDKMKDVRGILFEPLASAGNCKPIFVAFTEYTFKEKCLEIIKNKKITKKRR